MNSRLLIIKEFVDFCVDCLSIQSRPSISLVSNKTWVESRSSFGEYNPKEKRISVYVKNRNLADCLRTLSHELVHHRQNELNILVPGSGETGSDHENQANSAAGVLLREFGKLNKLIYEAVDAQSSSSFYRPGRNPAAGVVVFRNPNNLEVLLVKRSDDGEEGSGQWSFPAGHIETSAEDGQPFKMDIESPQEAAVRELEEETGLDISALTKNLAQVDFKRKPIPDSPNSFIEFYLYTILIPENLKTDHVQGLDDAQDAKWFKVKKAMSMPLAFDNNVTLKKAIKSYKK